jgi:uncharacterized membrane protein YcjF (UPF0283 family)
MEKEFRENERLGDPFDAPFTDSNRDTAGESRRREGDSGLGQPDPVAEDFREVSERQRREYKKQAEERLKAEFEQKLMELRQFNSSWELPRPIKGFIAWVLIFTAAVFGVFIVNQAVGFMVNIRNLNEPFSSIATAAMVFFGVILTAIIISLLWAALRMRRLKPIDIKPLTVLQQRADMQEFARRSKDESRKLFIDYLKGYSLNKKHTRVLINCGLKPEEVDSLAVCRDKLLDKNKPLSSGQWFDLFQDGWQSVLDRAVDRRIREYAIKCGLGTAASPVAFVDQMVVMYSCFAMLRDILRIYNLRPALGQTAVVLSRSIINIYLSGMMESATEGSANSLAEYISESCGKIAGTVGKVAGAKAAEGAINGVLIYNLGKRAKKMLQPMINN